MQGLIDEVLLHECPEPLRMDVVAEFIDAHKRPPTSCGDEVGEKQAAQYLASALERRHVSTQTGPQLAPEQVEQWVSVLRALPGDEVAPWAADPVLVAAQAYFLKHGHLKAQKRGILLQRSPKGRASLTEEEWSDDDSDASEDEEALEEMLDEFLPQEDDDEMD